MTPFAANSHQGRVHSHNEDSYEADPKLGLWLVADGVGGHTNGDVAARIVRDTIKTEQLKGTALVDAVKYAHRSVLDEIIARDSRTNMGSTVVAMSLKDDNTYEICWVGDSRAYLFDGELRQLTYDHTLAGELLASGEISQAQAASHPKRHVLSQSLGVSESINLEPGSISGRLKAGQQVLLCSDGLSDELNDDAIEEELKKHSTPNAQVNSLINAALRAGGRDNITAVIVGGDHNPGRTTSEAIADPVTNNNTKGASSITNLHRIKPGVKKWMIFCLAVCLVIWLWW